MRRAEFYGMMQKTLRKVDLASMENSLEVRVPFLKKSFIEASLKCDPMLSYGPDKKKQLLKDILLEKLPQSPVDNRKRGFSIPIGVWMRQNLKDPIGSIVLDTAMHQRFNLNSKAIQRVWDEHQEGSHDYKWVLFTLYSLFQWETNRTK
jgi:asparagine synthase (glutamine-hydrolysing)